MNERGRFLKASLTYGAVQFLALAASLVSFPILTRLLSVSDYGVLGLGNVVLLFGAAVAKLGLQNSIVRYYPRYRHEEKLPILFSTVWFGGVASAVVVCLLLLPIALFVAPPHHEQTFLAVTSVVFSTALFSIGSNVLRAGERNYANSVATVFLRYGGTFGGIAVVFLGYTGIAGIFWAQFVASLLVALWCLADARKSVPFALHDFSWDTFTEAVSFGAPLVMYEMSSIVLAFSDRILVTRYCGIEQLGIYTAGYAIAFSIADLIRQPLQLSVQPINVRIFTEKGLTESASFLRDAIAYAAAIILPVIAGSIALRHELVVALASSKYYSAATVVPWVVASTLLFGCQSVLAPSFYLFKKTKQVAFLSVLAASLNVLLNLILLKRFGIIAAAWSTAIAYTLLTAAMATISYRSLRIRFPLYRIAIYFFASLQMYLVLTSSLPSLPGRIITGAAIYFVIVLFLDKELLGELQTLMTRMRRVGGTA